MRERLLADGLSVSVPSFESADVCVVNTCTVTREADKDALVLLRRIAKRNPAARLLVTGCLATRSPGEIREAAPHAEVFSNGRRGELPASLGCRPAPGEAAISGFNDRARAFLKIQDGCNMRCAYCIIPSVRPALSCKPFPALLSETRGLLERGYRELVLCGIRLGRYLGEDEAGRRVDFPGLLERLLALPWDFRVRLSSFEVTDLTERFLDLSRGAQGRLCPSFHVPLQSGSERTLGRMGRWYSAAFYARRVESLRARLPEAGLFTDVMAGFPGETETDFSESFRFVEGMGFSGLHVFRYSKRQGTPAARLEGQLSEGSLLERAGRLRELDGRLRADFAARHVGARRRVLAEGAEGLTEHFLKARLDANPGPGLHWVRIEAREGEVVRARVVGS